jgi:hypothetical protein
MFAFWTEVIKPLAHISSSANLAIFVSYLGISSLLDEVECDFVSVLSSCIRIIRSNVRRVTLYFIACNFTYVRLNY